MNTRHLFFMGKNRFVGWTGKDDQSPTIKGLDGLANSNPRWVRKWFFKIVEEIIKRPDSRSSNVPRILKESMFELDNVISKSSKNIENELKFTQGLRKDPSRYKKDVKTGKLGILLGKDKGEEVHWYETTCTDEQTNGNYSHLVPTELNELNLKEYKRLLLSKLKDTLEITNINFKQLELELLHQTLPIEYY